MGFFFFRLLPQPLVAGVYSAVFIDLHPSRRMFLSILGPVIGYTSVSSERQTLWECEKNRCVLGERLRCFKRWD